MADRTRGDATLAMLKESYYEELIGLELLRKQQNDTITLEGIQANLELIGKLTEFATRIGIDSSGILDVQERVYHDVLDALRSGGKSMQDIYSDVRGADEEIDRFLKSAREKVKIA